jgi:ferredoxin
MREGGSVRAVEPRDSGRLARALEPLHSMVYFAPEAEERYVAAGLRAGRMGYFASRAAPMGAVGPGVVTAVFAGFNPGLVARHIPAAWQLAAPATVVGARFAAVDAALRRMLGDDVVTSAEVAEAAELARRAAEACPVEGRPLAAAHLDLPWPEAAHLRLWHALSVLREHRGDGHVALVVEAGLDGLEALVSHTASGRGLVPEFARASRGWSEGEWGAAAARLRERGVLDADGALTAAGAALRTQLEVDTDRLGAPPWQRLGAGDAARLGELGRALVRTLLAAGCFPRGVLAPR